VDYFKRKIGQDLPYIAIYVSEFYGYVKSRRMAGFDCLNILRSKMFYD